MQKKSRQTSPCRPVLINLSRTTKFKQTNNQTGAHIYKHQTGNKFQNLN
jgi:hypothetical protein